MSDHSGYSRYAIRANERPYYRIAYWCKGVWCNDPEAWDRCTVTPMGAYTYAEQTFTREEADKIPRLLAFLETVFDAGRADAKAEIRRVLGV